MHLLVFAPAEAGVVHSVSVRRAALPGMAIVAVEGVLEVQVAGHDSAEEEDPAVLLFDT